MNHTNAYSMSYTYGISGGSSKVVLVTGIIVMAVVAVLLVMRGGSNDGIRYSSNNQ